MADSRVQIENKHNIQDEPGAFYSARMEENREKKFPKT